ncbi:hypothetical protein HY626_04085 [Candidatus Uhrbacteria bacterium]|nr:hypothetical protein [Candidatus Uhrbacteria bacterium]
MTSNSRLFRLAALALSLLIVEGLLQGIDLSKRLFVRKVQREWSYRANERGLLALQNAGMQAVTWVREDVGVSQELIDIVPGKYWTPKPNRTIAMVYNKRIGHMHVPLTPQTAPLLEGFEGGVALAHYDTQGFRRTAWPGAADSARPMATILMLGDSFTEGPYVDDVDTIAAKLERLGMVDGLRLRVLNAGVSGYNTREERFRLADILLEVTPDLVLLNVFANDTGFSEHVTVGHWKPTKPQSVLGQWLVSHLLTVKVLTRCYYSLFGRLADPRSNVALQANWQEVFEHLDVIHQQCAERKITFYIAAIPPKEQFEHSRKEFYQMKLANFCSPRGFGFIDPYEDLQVAGAAKLYLDWDPHFTKEGNAVYANALYRALRKSGWPKPPD